MSVATETPPAEPAEVTSIKPSQLPLFEGHRVTDNEVSFGGSITLEDLDLVKSMKLNGEFELVVRGRINTRTHRVKRDEAGNVVKTTSVSNLVVESVTAYDAD